MYINIKKSYWSRSLITPCQILLQIKNKNSKDSDNDDDNNNNIQLNSFYKGYIN